MNKHNSRHALTLIEMLVGMAITLVMMAAVVNLFANLGSGVSFRRATMEMNTQLRMTRARLFKDLAGATCRAIPKIAAHNDEDADGYIEIIEGDRTDTTPYDPDVLTLDSTTIIPGSQVNPLDGSSLGDYDDVLALTVQSDTEPFIGSYDGNTIESKKAEVVWFAIQNPSSGSLGEPGLRTVYRRALLIAPWLSPLPDPVGDPVAYYQENDISAHYDPNFGSDGGWIPNTLADLVKREHRFAHDPTTFPHVMLSRGVGYGGAPNVDPNRDQSPDELPANASNDARIVAVLDNQSQNSIGQILTFEINNNGRYRMLPRLLLNPPPPGPLARNATARPVMQLVEPDIAQLAHVTFGPAPLAFDRQGEDVMLSNVLAFDIQVFDPGAPLFEFPANSGNIIEPSAGAIFANAVSGTLSGFGAYVDLGWDDNQDYIHNPSSGAPEPWFQEERRLGWHPLLASDPPNTNDPYRQTPAVFDTWSLHYESDGLNQDFGTDNSNPWRDRLDQANNSLDDNDLNGVDLQDPDEYETSPPYRRPLRAMQVKFRIFERDTRQIRESTVVRSFVD